MKSLMTWIITIGLFLFFILLAMAIPKKAHAHDDHQKPQTIPGPAASTPVAKKHDHSWQMPVLVIGISGAVCWFYCGDEKPEPMPDPGPAVKNDITPDNVKDKPRQFLIEAE